MCRLSRRVSGSNCAVWQLLLHHGYEVVCRRPCLCPSSCHGAAFPVAVAHAVLCCPPLPLCTLCWVCWGCCGCCAVCRCVLNTVLSTTCSGQCCWATASLVVVVLLVVVEVGAAQARTGPLLLQLAVQGQAAASPGCSCSRSKAEGRSSTSLEVDLRPSAGSVVVTRAKVLCWVEVAHSRGAHQPPGSRV